LLAFSRVTSRTRLRLRVRRPQEPSNPSARRIARKTRKKLKVFGLRHASEAKPACWSVPQRDRTRRARYRRARAALNHPRLPMAVLFFVLRDRHRRRQGVSCLRHFCWFRQTGSAGVGPEQPGRPGACRRRTGFHTPSGLPARVPSVMCGRPRRSRGDLVCCAAVGAVMCPAYVARPYDRWPDAIGSLAPKQIYALEWRITPDGFCQAPGSTGSPSRHHRPHSPISCGNR